MSKPDTSAEAVRREAAMREGSTERLLLALLAERDAAHAMLGEALAHIEECEPKFQDRLAMHLRIRALLAQSATNSKEIG